MLWKNLLCCVYIFTLCSALFTSESALAGQVFLQRIGVGFRFQPLLRFMALFSFLFILSFESSFLLAVRKLLVMISFQTFLTLKWDLQKNRQKMTYHHRILNFLTKKHTALAYYIFSKFK